MSELIEVKTIGEVERIVHGSSLWDGTGPVEFSNDGVTWTDAWAPTTEHPLPTFARVAVYRKEVRVPTAVTIRWDEQVPRNDEFWAGKWVSAPTRHFGRTARMVAYRQTFRDLLGDIMIEDEDRTGPDTTPADAAPAAERDWAAEIAEADSVTLDAIERDGRAARIFTPDAAGTALHRALKERRRALAAAEWDTLTTVPEQPKPTPVRPAPQDHLPPVNRAARRKAARKKGGKR